MKILDVDGLTFNFPDNWNAIKYDDSQFYRQHFSRQKNGIKAVDVLALSPDKTLFFIEAKDYSHPETIKPSELPTAIVNKVLYTLSSLLPSSINASEESEQKFSRKAIKSKKLCVVIHLEQSNRHRLKVVPADLLQKLKPMLRAIDAHPKVLSMHKMANAAWSVSK